MFDHQRPHGLWSIAWRAVAFVLAVAALVAVLLAGALTNVGP